MSNLNLPAKFLYKPTGQPGKKPNFRFDNSSGELM
jgi:hypothetical protein